MKCGKCGFENGSSLTSCAKCNSRLSSNNPFSILDSTKNEDFYNCSSCNYLVPSSQDVCSSCGNNRNGIPDRAMNTIPLSEFRHATSNVGFKLEPMNHEGLTIEVVEEDVVLSRDNIDPNDLTISSDDHVRFVNDGGRWYIENSSSNNAVFLQVTNRMEIKDGAILILGQSKVFKFKV